MPAAATPVLLEDWIDPARVHAAFLDASHTFWLDAGPSATTGWSWVGIGSPADAAELRRTPLERLHSDGAVTARGAAPDAPHRTGGPFRGGWVGWLGYESGASDAGAPVAADDLPAESWMRADTLVAFDHAARSVWIVAGDADAVTRRIRIAPDADVAAPPSAPVTAAARVGADDYARLIEDCRASIGRGEAYLLCLTTRFTVRGDIDPIAAHAALRAASPSHHGTLIRTGDVALVSASPERFLEVADGIVRTRPIKGTRPRGASADDDAALAADLAADPKERAENVMIVDLMRNDLARVCDPATVTVERLLDIESYATVHQLVSTVAGRPRPGATVGDLWAATFPAGSMTGAPKLSAMTILHRLEEEARGAFSGCFGWVGEDGRLDLAMTIRTVVTFPGGAYVSAGGGITWASVPAAEVAEVALKASAPLRAIGATLPEDWASRGPVT
ncbi:anthranilate synthase component I family protein [Microbacterium sp. cx-55]|uniref:anthranilate synthase component I family protein n=1 Tax=unclassified Microbacterium TaxID=2609290 RepID=UPI001CBC0D29|nr:MULTISPECIES: anthranilate synthase component I family protein [unclassified Microbacterium]MBZ4486236.1 anthranilate synthase component I family protein [Microbacterium sp. cx-55]MCC4907226.1 anthranilate synthase component I family protein [Microbacterium sp. cx-59]UGB33898.1 anthranilate synthase component I family protein [Microbacterium sp. cx-55]